MDKRKTIFVAIMSIIMAFYFISIKYIMPPNSPVPVPKYKYTPLAKLTARANKRKTRIHRFGGTQIVQLPPVLSLEPYRNFTYDQGDLGSCTANAFCGAYRIMCAIHKVNQSFEPSRLFFYYQERLIEGTPMEDSGADVIDGESYVMENGICSERLCPYIISHFTNEPSKECYVEAQTYKIANYAVLDNGPQSNILNEIKMAINNDQPVLIAIAIYSSFESPSVAKTGHVPIPDTINEECLGGHEMCLIGYNDETQCFTVMNSWGEQWGNGGLCYIPYGYLGNRDLAQEFTVFHL
jgi:C1A family cysteine protease